MLAVKFYGGDTIFQIGSNRMVKDMLSFDQELTYALGL